MSKHHKIDTARVKSPKIISNSASLICVRAKLALKHHTELLHALGSAHPGNYIIESTRFAPPSPAAAVVRADELHSQEPHQKH